MIATEWQSERQYSRQDVVTESLISTVAKSSLPKQKDVKQMDRNTFVREVSTLIHVSNFAPATRTG